MREATSARHCTVVSHADHRTCVQNGVVGRRVPKWILDTLFHPGNGPASLQLNPDRERIAVDFEGNI
jgi:hypothetical protein